MSQTVLVMLHRASSQDEPGSAPAPDFSLADPHHPQISVLDLAVTRGDGVFESISVIDGRPHALEAHLERLSRSAETLEIPTPDRDIWRAAITEALRQLDPVAEAFVRAVLSRGIEGSGTPTGWVYAAPAPNYERVRADGVSVALLDRGYNHDAARTAPWLLVGAKSLSYAVNRAAMREALRRGSDEVIFISSDGYVLEGATSTVLYRRGNQLLTPGDPDGLSVGVLEGTTQGEIFAWATRSGWETAVELLPVEDLASTDAIWLLSSSRHAVPVHTLNGVVHPVDRETTSAMNAYLLKREE